MANNLFYVPKLKDNGAWLDYRGQYPGGYGWRYDRALSKIKFAANHHSVTNPSKNAKKDCDTLWSIHKANGWGGIGYNFIITSEEVKGKDGLAYAKIAYVGDIGSVRAHTANVKGAKGIPAGLGNEYIVAACMIGQLHLKNPTAAQIRSAYWLYREIITQEKGRMPNVTGKLNDKLAGHQDFDPTACPGNWGYQKKAIVNYTDPPKVEKKTETRTSPILFTKKTQDDPTLLEGLTKVAQAGKDGLRTIVTEITYTNGKETSRKTVSDKIAPAAVDELTLVGTKKPEPEVPPAPPTPPESDISWIKRAIQAMLDFFKISIK